MHKASIFLLTTLLFAGCMGEDEPRTFEWTHEPAPIAETEPEPEVVPVEIVANENGVLGERVRFLIIGDQGSGEQAQFDVAAAMERTCTEKGCDFVMTNGDNIYDFGAISDQDMQFVDKFEMPYQHMVDTGGNELPFYLSLGNHDNLFGGFSQAVGESQVEYSYRADRESSRWNMPDRYYSQRFGNVLEIFALDTDSLKTDDRTVTDVTPKIHQQWAREALDASNATWKIAFGHYNYISNGNYGDGSSDFKAAIENSICDRAHFYSFGHDHDLQWLNPVESCGRTEFIGSSAAAKSRAVNSEEFESRFGMGDVLGYAWVEIIGESFHLEFIDHENNTLFAETVTKTELGW